MKEREKPKSLIFHICEENKKKKFQISLSLLNNNLIETTTNEWNKYRQFLSAPNDMKRIARIT